MVSMATAGWLVLCGVTVAVLLLLWEPVFQRNVRRYRYYRMARARAHRLGRRLVVIGAPDAGEGRSAAFARTLRLYGCGDECVDLGGGCVPRCGDTRHTRVDALAYLRGLPDDSRVLFVSVVLEYVDDLPALVWEMERVAGSLRDNVFVVHIDDDHLPRGVRRLFSAGYTGAGGGPWRRRWRIKKAPPTV